MTGNDPFEPVLEEDNLPVPAADTDIVTIADLPAMILTVAAAEVAIGLAILVTFFRTRGSVAVEDITAMKG